MISGVKVKTLKVIPDERGRLMEILRSDDKIFENFGQVYYTTAYPGVVKAWHYHKKQADFFTCISGMVKLVLYDGRPKSKTYKKIQEFFMGVHNPVLVRIPPNVYHGFKCIGKKEEAIMLNIPTRPFSHKNPDEYRIDVHTSSIPYDWGRKDR
ncbi:MAG: dTDP-4-dehydrorhamnose 3,5-epimerase family protein [Candidatus Omnitrophica bacterium]|nr:dTDP-4-dehydrorhamnose 3,5-epimerase family protein [Candidatus Omnitrophota bacterium]